jgi:hypothetical protein
LNAIFLNEDNEAYSLKCQAFTLHPPSLPPPQIFPDRKMKNGHLIIFFKENTLNHILTDSAVECLFAKKSQVSLHSDIP